MEMPVPAHFLPFLASMYVARMYVLVCMPAARLYSWQTDYSVETLSVPLCAHVNMRPVDLRCAPLLTC